MRSVQVDVQVDSEIPFHETRILIFDKYNIVSCHSNHVTSDKMSTVFLKKVKMFQKNDCHNNTKKERAIPKKKNSKKQKPTILN